MSQSSSQSRKRTHGSSTKKSSATGKSSNTSPYDGDFEQKMIDRGIYPDGYEGLNGDPPEPNNIEAIRQALAQPRGSLSPSRLSNSAFANFKRENRRATSESKAVTNVIPHIVGSKDGQYETAGDVFFYNMEEFDPHITAPKPDMYYGSRPSQIDLRLRDDLGKYIVPSSRASLPAAPNFFREDKGASGRADVAQRQVMLDLAVGARCMLQLQNYGNATPVYDGNAYTIASSYHPGTGTLQVYATHPSQPTSAAGEPQYYMTQLDTYAMTGNINSFRSGAAAYRNAREWTQQQRDCFIANANAVAQRRSTETRSFSRTENNTIVSSAVADESTSSETSADELALDYDTAAKRRRRLKSSKPVNLHPFDIGSC